MECVVTRHAHCVKTSVSVTPKMVPVFVPRDSLVLYVTKVSPSILIYIDLYDCYSIIHVQFIYTFVIINMSLTCMYCFMKKYFLLSLSVCPDGYYGYKCSAKCSCENGANCSKSDGRCDCPPGYIGASCSQSKLQTPLLIFFV